MEKKTVPSLPRGYQNKVQWFYSCSFVLTSPALLLQRKKNLSIFFIVSCIGFMRCTFLIFLTHFWPMLQFHTPWKHKKTFGFLVLPMGKMETLTWNGLTHWHLMGLKFFITFFMVLRQKFELNFIFLDFLHESIDKWVEWAFNYLG